MYDVENILLGGPKCGGAYTIRTHILTKTKILELALFPSSFFPGVNFGHANLSIITLQKTNNLNDSLNNEFKVLNSFKTVEQLANINENELKVFTFTQKEILSNPDYAFLISDNSEIALAINSSKIKVGDVA